MKKIRTVMWGSFAGAILIAMVGIVMFVCFECRTITKTMLFFLLLMAGALFGLGAHSATLLRKARLIIGNRLMYISPVMLAESVGDPISAMNTEIVVSCFGVLVDSSIIPFNRKANRLWHVEIGRDSLQLVYGSQSNQKTIVLLHAPIDLDTARELGNRFGIETGAKITYMGSLCE